MSLRRDGDVLHLEGDCPVEEAEALVSALLAGGLHAADLSACRHLHAALVQALLVFALPVKGEPKDDYLRDIVMPALRTAIGETR